jgi:hypothetical protein
MSSSVHPPPPPHLTSSRLRYVLADNAGSAELNSGKATAVYSVHPLLDLDGDPIATVKYISSAMVDKARLQGSPEVFEFADTTWHAYRPEKLAPDYADRFYELPEGVSTFET